MIRQLSFVIYCAIALLVSLALSTCCQAQIGYGTNSNGTLFRFDVNNPSVVTTIGDVGFEPEGMDFLPGSNILYAIDIPYSAVKRTSQLYTIDIDTAVATPVGPDFSTNGDGYNINTSPRTPIGFDIDPKSLQPDGSMRIQLVTELGFNIELSTKTGQVVAVDRTMRFAESFNDETIEALAFINNIPEMGGETTCYAIDTELDDLYTLEPPDLGWLYYVGPLTGANNPGEQLHFDVFTRSNDIDPGIGGDFGYAVIDTTGAPYQLFDVNLGTGAVTNGRIVGPANAPFSFSGGFAVLPIPEPASCAMCLSAIPIGMLLSRRRRAVR